MTTQGHRDQAGWLLGQDEPPAVRIVNPAGRSPFVLLCEHASNRVPACLGNLGLRDSDLALHIAWDIGALAVAERLSALLDATLIVQNYSRLVCDCNRSEDAPDLIVTCADGTEVFGNAALDAGARQARIDEVYAPFHAAAASVVEECLVRGMRPAILGIHSFTPVMSGIVRPWHIGILYPRPCSLAADLLHACAKFDDLIIGDNAPYSLLEDRAETMERHGVARGLEAAEIEIRQDLLTTPENVLLWAERIAATLNREG